MSSYYKNLPIVKVKGFVVKIFDTVNLDIDLELNDELKQRYSHVRRSEYECLGEIDEDKILQKKQEIETLNQDRIDLIQEPIVTGLKQLGDSDPLFQNETTKVRRMRRTMYKCHLKGLSYCKIDRTMKAKEILFIQNFLDRTGYWVDVEISDIDSYGRILVTINNSLGQRLNDELLNASVNLSVYRLRKAPQLPDYLEEYNTYFYSSRSCGESVG